MTDERNTYIVAVTGGRDYDDTSTIARALRERIAHASNIGRIPVLLTGGCPTGADELARRWWHRAQRPYVVVPARWEAEGRRAGLARNGRMAAGLALHADPWLRADVLLVFPGGSGTADCAGRFRAAGVEVLEVAS